MGLLDFLGGGEEAKAKLVTVDPSIQADMTKNRDQVLNKSTDDYSKESMAGVDGPKDYSSQVNQSEQALGGSEPGMSGAINQRYQGLVGEKLNSMSGQAKMRGFETKSRNLETVNKFDQAKQNIDAENKQRQLQADNAAAHARNSALSSVLGIGAMVGAAALTGGAAAPLLAGTAMKGLSTGGGSAGNNVA